MGLPFTIRKIDWNNTDKRGVPKDCIDIISYFNRALKEQKYPFIPRKKPITSEEVLIQWKSTRDTNITYLAVDKQTGRVVGAGTLILDQDKKTGSLSIAKDPDYKNIGIGKEITQEIIREAHQKGLTVIVHTSVENKAMKRIMDDLDYKVTGEIKDFEPYRGHIKAKNYAAYEWIIPPK